MPTLPGLWASDHKMQRKSVTCHTHTRTHLGFRVEGKAWSLGPAFLGGLGLKAGAVKL